MKTEGRHPDEGTEPDDNVVMFPREWIGPREDLVPIGLAPPDQPEAPPAPDDFWGAGSAEVQSALRAPTSADVNGTAHAEPESPERLPRLARRRTVGLPIAIGLGAAAIVATAVGVFGVGASATSRLRATTRHHSEQQLANEWLGSSAGRVSTLELASAATKQHASAVAHRPSRDRGRSARRSTSRRDRSRARHTGSSRGKRSSNTATSVSATGSSNVSTSDYAGSSSGYSAPPPSTSSDAVGGGAAPGPTSLGGAVGNNCNPKCGS